MISSHHQSGTVPPVRLDFFSDRSAECNIRVHNNNIKKNRQLCTFFKKNNFPEITILRVNPLERDYLVVCLDFSYRRSSHPYLYPVLILAGRECYILSDIERR